MGGKPSTLSDHEAAIKVALREVESGNISLEMLDTLARIGVKVTGVSQPSSEQTSDPQELDAGHD